MGSNYAPTILPQAEAQRKHGTPQVLYTLPAVDGSDPESAVISESGAMNCFFLLDKVSAVGLFTGMCLLSGFKKLCPHLSEHCIKFISPPTLMCSKQADGSGQVLTTPPLDGTILPGVTRDSILALARAWNDVEVSETYLTIREIKQVTQKFVVMVI